MLVQSLKDKSEFDVVFNEGRRYQGKYLSLIIRRGTNGVKLGIIVNKKYGGAVERNKIKRRIKEAIRKFSSAAKKGTEIVVLPKPGAARIGYKEIADDIAIIAGKADII